MILEHDLTIKAGSEYIVDLVYADDDEQPVDVSGWSVESQIRNAADNFRSYPFTGTADEEGFHLTMSEVETRALRFAHGVYDVFITDPDGKRWPLIQGSAEIIPEVTR